VRECEREMKRGRRKRGRGWVCVREMEGEKRKVKKGRG
jgi:hypothetical protein